MGKLKIPENPLWGSPLTDEELKSILGGQGNVTKTCLCNFIYHGSMPAGYERLSSAPRSASTYEICRQKCNNACDNHDYCVNFTFNFTVTG